MYYVIYWQEALFPHLFLALINEEVKYLYLILCICIETRLIISYSIFKDRNWWQLYFCCKNLCESQPFTKDNPWFLRKHPPMNVIYMLYWSPKILNCLGLAMMCENNDIFFSGVTDFLCIFYDPIQITCTILFSMCLPLTK